MSRKKTTGAPPPDRRLLAAAALCALTLLAFSSSFQAGFAWDNQYLILKDPRIRAATAENIGLIFHHTYWWPTGESGLYRPLTTLSYLFNYAVLGNGEQPSGYHWLNLLLHAGNVLLVYALALRLAPGFWPPLFLAAMWGVHPALTESVTNIVGRSDLLAGMATLSGLLIYMKGARSVGWLAGLMAVTAAGVYSKESAVVIVGVIALYELLFRRDYRSLLLGLAATLPPVALLLWQRSSVLAATAPAEWPFTDNPIAAADFWTGRMTAIAVMCRYLWLAVWPAKLSVDYSWAQIPLSSGVWPGLFALLAAGAMLLLYWRNRTVFFLACFTFLTFLPASNLLFPIGTIMAERLLYLPLVGLLGCLVLAISAAGKGLAPVAFCLIVAGFAARTWARNLDWKDDLALVRASLRASPGSFKLHKVYASSLYASDPSHSNFDRVTAEAEKALSILGSLPDALNEPDTWRWAGGFFLAKGDLQARQGKPGRPAYERARDVLLRCIAIDRAIVEAHHRKMTPASEPEAHRLLSAVYLRLGDVDKAADEAGRARSLDPANPEQYHQSAEVLLARQDGEAAAVTLMEGFLLSSDPGLRDDLMTLYRGGLDAAGCAISAGPHGPAMNPDCPIVHRHICAAAARSEKLRRTAAAQFGCPI